MGREFKPRYIEYYCTFILIFINEPSSDSPNWQSKEYSCQRHHSLCFIHPLRIPLNASKSTHTNAKLLLFCYIEIYRIVAFVWYSILFPSVLDWFHILFFVPWVSSIISFCLAILGYLAAGNDPSSDWALIERRYERIYLLLLLSIMKNHNEEIPSISRVSYQLHHKKIDKLLPEWA